VFVLFEILPSGDQKKKKWFDTSTKDFLGNFLKNLQDYEKEKGKRCQI